MMMSCSHRMTCPIHCLRMMMVSIPSWLQRARSSGRDGLRPEEDTEDGQLVEASLRHPSILRPYRSRSMDTTQLWDSFRV